MGDFPKILDRDGREVKIGDRVKILADECNKFLQDCYGEYWLPVMQYEEDEYGTVVFKDNSLQVVDKNGKWLFDISLYSKGDKEPYMVKE